MPLKIVSDGAIATVTRRFAAPPERVWEAHVNPDLLRRWLLGPDGWSMTECVNEAWAGGRIRYVWREDATGDGFSLTGEFLEVDPPHRTVHVERMHLGPKGPDPTDDNRVETRFESDGSGGTLMTMTMTLPSPEALRAMLASGMEQGMEASYARLEAEIRS